MQSLTIRRGRVKGALTRIFTYASDIPLEATITDIDLKRQKLEEIWTEYHQIDTEIIEKVTDTTSITEDYLIEFEDNYYRTMKLLNDYISEMSRQAIANNSVAQASNNAAFNSTLQHEIRTDKQLPKIHIKPFSGDLTAWDTFRDLYVSTVHSNHNLSNCQKFYYLKGFLVGEPCNLLTHISVSDSNYTEAWEKLNKRYDKKGHIANALVKKFINLLNLNQSSYTSLRKLVDSVDEIIRGLRALGSDAETRDIWLTHLLLNKLDIDTQNAWANTASEENFPKFDTFFAFLEKRCDILAASFSTDRNRKIITVTPNKTPQSSTNFKSFHTVTQNTPSCLKCQSAHELYQCAQFSSMSPQLRRSFVQSKSLCFNCLRACHRSTVCRSLNTCKQCHNRHHSLLHHTTNLTRSSPSTPTNLTSIQSSSTPIIVQGTSQETPSRIRSNHSIINSTNALINTHTTHSSKTTQFKSYLPTAVVNTVDRFGTRHSVRILLDLGSECSFMTENCADRLGLIRSNARIPVSGLSSTCAGITRGSVKVRLQSRISDKSITLFAYVMPKLTGLLPTFKENFTHTPPIEVIKLADPEYNQPGPIDILVGADKTFLLFENQVLKGPPGTPNAVLSIFGWVIAVHDDLELTRFWELEEVTTSQSHLSEDEQFTEKHYASTHSRSLDGKYVVELPFKDGSFNFGNTLASAIIRQKAMERKFAQNASLKENYTQFMTEYHDLGHKSLVPSNEINLPSDKCYYLPHHAVCKENSSTTQLRVVFDGSSSS